MRGNTEELFGLLPLYHTLCVSYPAQMRIARFVVSGGTATIVNLGALFVFTQMFQIWYLFSSIFAFGASFLVSFTLQKFWTFGDTSRERIHTQASIFLVVIVTALVLNTTLLYLFVEYAHLHYLLAQLISGIFIAFINFYSYRHFVFRTSEYSETVPGRWSLSIQHVLPLLLAVAIFLSLALFRLSENPPTWLDEGSIVQVSINLSNEGIYGIQIAPHRFVSTDFLTTGFPVIHPIALSFSLFGTTLFNARVVMVLYMTLLCVCSYFLIRALATEKKYFLSLSSLLLLVTFAPLYGHGKNVLGEVPGLMFFIASLIVFYFAEKNRHSLLWLISGVLVGLSMATKPIYLFIIAPSAALTFLLLRQHIPSKNMFVYAAGVSGPLVVWFSLQVASVDALRQILFAANVNSAPLSERLLHTGMQFVSEPQPIYFLTLLVIWSASILLRSRREASASHVELFAYIFSIINFVLYLASRGFYRYFFAAEVLALIFLPIALYQVPVNERYRKVFKRSCAGFLILLVLFQGYQTLFHSWISEFRSSERSGLLSKHMRNIPIHSSIFFYNVPEAVIFLSSSNYYQYLRYGDTVIRGDENLALLFSGVPDFLLVDGKFPHTENITPLYTEVSRFDKYILYKRSGR